MQTMHIYAFADEAAPSFAGQIAAMVRNGLQGIEIRNVEGVNVSDMPLDMARRLRNELDAAGLKCFSIGSPIGKISITDRFEPHLDKLRHTLQVAEILGAKNLRMFSFYIPAGEDPAIHREEVLRRLRVMLDVARGSGVRFCHENEKGIYGDNASRCADLLAQLPELCQVFDPANFIQCGQETLSAWALLKDRTVYLHVKDALEDGTVVPAGKGIGNVAAITSAYRAMGGCDATIEPHLRVFDGLASLERAGEATRMDDFTYPTGDAAFDAACSAFKALL